jgi:hypothetical protein
MQAIGRGGPRTRAGLEWPAPVIVLEALARFVSPETIRSVLTRTGRESQRIRRLPATAGQLHVVENYWEAAGIIATLRAGISPESVRRPLPATTAVKKTLRLGTAKSAAALTH